MRAPKSPRPPSTVDGRTVKLTNQDKVLFPNDGYTKGDLVRYYRAVAPVILPYLRANPLTMERFPDGIAASRGIWEKQIPRYTPEWVRPREIRRPPARRAR